MHVEEVAVALPLRRVLDGGEGIQRIDEAEVRLQGGLQVVDVLHGIIGVVIEMLAVEVVDCSA